MPNYITDIKQIIISARVKSYTAINSAMVETYWLIGKRIVEEKAIIDNIQQFLLELGKGFAFVSRQQEILRIQLGDKEE